MSGKMFLATPKKILCASRVERIRTFCRVGTCIVANTTAQRGEMEASQGFRVVEEVSLIYGDLRGKGKERDV